MPWRSSTISAVAIDDNERVRAGTILFRIQEDDYRAHLEAAKAAVAMKQAALINLDRQIDLQRAVIVGAEANQVAAKAQAERASLDLQRYMRLIKAAAASQQVFDNAHATEIQARAGKTSAETVTAQAQRKLDVLAAQKEEALADLRAGRAAEALAKIALDNTIIRAPVDGVIGDRNVRLGRYVTPGAPVLALVPLMGKLQTTVRMTSAFSNAVRNAISVTLVGTQSSAISRNGSLKAGFSPPMRRRARCPATRPASNSGFVIRATSRDPDGVTASMAKR
jgi:multidrug resistance efflux pump